MANSTKKMLVEYRVLVDSTAKECAIKEFCKEQGMALTLTETTFFESLKYEYFKPSAKLKELCGKEWLANGLISMKEAYDFLETYIKIHRLDKGPLILLNDTLKELFYTSENVISKTELIQILPKILLPHRMEDSLV